MVEMSPFKRRPSQYFSASSWGHDTRQATPLVCASCTAGMALQPTLAVIPGGNSTSKIDELPNIVHLSIHPLLPCSATECGTSQLAFRSTSHDLMKRAGLRACMQLMASSMVKLSSTLSSTLTTYSRRLKSSLCSITR